MGETRAVVLLSGGLDSATTLAWAKARGWRCWALTVDYGQRHAAELACAGAQAEAQGVEAHRVVKLEFDFGESSVLTRREAAVPNATDPADIGGTIPPTYVPARNTILLSLALAWAEILRADAILLGANAVDYSGYPDCRPEYLAAYERMALLATKHGLENGGPRLATPLIDSKKSEIIRLSSDLGVDLGRTFSCYDPSPDGRPCTRCEACVLRARGFEEAGLADPLLRPLSEERSE